MALEREVQAERWTNLDRAPRELADGGAGIADLRPAAPNEDSELRRLMRAQRPYPCQVLLASDRDHARLGAGASG